MSSSKKSESEFCCSEVDVFSKTVDVFDRVDCSIWCDETFDVSENDWEVEKFMCEVLVFSFVSNAKLESIDAISSMISLSCLKSEIIDLLWLRLSLNTYSLYLTIWLFLIQALLMLSRMNWRIESAFVLKSSDYQSWSLFIDKSKMSKMLASTSLRRIHLSMINLSLFAMKLFSVICSVKKSLLHFSFSSFVEFQNL